MQTMSTPLTLAAVALAASPALAQPAPAYTLVPVAERLSFGDVFADAARRSRP